MRPESTSFLLLLSFLFRRVTGQDMRFVTDCLTPNHKAGLCVEIQSCKKFLSVLDDIDTYEFLRASRCGPANEDPAHPKVCCGPDINYDKDSLTEKNIEIITAAPTPPSKMLTGSCGKQKLFFNNRVFGGIEAGVGEFPWMARLVHLNRYNRIGLGCSGFLVHKKFVLTAAHCIRGQGIQALGDLNHVLLGVHNDTRASICFNQTCTDSPVSYEVLEPIVHPNYDQRNHNNDIALIPLKEKVVYTNFIKAICLAATPTNNHWMTISGWGRTETDASSKTKLKVELPRANHTYCVEKYKSLGLTITDKQLCAGGERGNDSCAGDSGGPLMVLDENTNSWYAEGIVSYGNGCGREEWPGVYTSIPKYYSWIVDNIKSKPRTNNISRFG